MEPDITHFHRGQPLWATVSSACSASSPLPSGNGTPQVPFGLLPVPTLTQTIWFM